MASVSDPIAKEAKKGAQVFSGYAHEAANAVNDAGHDLRDIAGRAGRSLRTIVDSSKHELVEAADHYKSAVLKHPMQASLAVLGAGFLLGFLMRR